MKKYKAILFDFDGVIGRTMNDNYKAWKNTFSPYGIKIEKNEYFLLEGLNTKKVAEHFFKKKGKKISARTRRKIIDFKEDYYIKNNQFSFYDGVLSLINKLKRKGYLLGLVSGASLVRISKTVNKSFLRKFDAVITGDKVKKSKPSPESYLIASKQLALKPTECIVIENAPIGIKSAKRAGMDCIAICSTLSKKHLNKADKIIGRVSLLEKEL